MNVAVIGSGYVALSTAVSMAHLGNKVVCFDDDKTVIERLSQAQTNINEQGLTGMLAHSLQSGNLLFTNNLDDVLSEVEVVICAVVTPVDKTTGAADNSIILKLAERIGERLTQNLTYVSQSTIPLGTTKQVKNIVLNKIEERGIKNIEFDVVSMPEFLREGAAIESFMNPNRVVLGCENEKAYSIILSLLAPVIKPKTELLKTTIQTAELIKLASNMLVATRISYMNTLSELCEKTGAEYDTLHTAIFGAIPNYVGVGYSGTCFPKDVRTLIAGAKEVGAEATLLAGVECYNEHRKVQLFNKFKEYYSCKISGKKVALWGVSAKPNSDDIENTSSLQIVKQLISAGCRVAIYDLVAAEKFVARIESDYLTYDSDKYEILHDAEALIILSNAQEFQNPDWRLVKEKMKTALVLSLFSSSAQRLI